MNAPQMYHFFKIGRLGSEGTLDFKDPSEEVIVRILYNKIHWKKSLMGNG